MDGIYLSEEFLPKNAFRVWNNQAVLRQGETVGHLSKQLNSFWGFYAIFLTGLLFCLSPHFLAQ